MPLLPEQLSVLVIAPVGRDSRLIRDALVAAGLTAQIVQDVEDAIRSANEPGIGALLIGEEVLNVANISRLRDQLAAQPTWSDLPLLILTIGGSATTLSRRREQDRLPLGSVTLLDRPIRAATLISSVRSALRSRARQYQVRDILLERDRADAGRRESESRLQTAVETARLGTWDLHVASGAMGASPTCRQNLGFEPGEPLTYDLFLNCIHPEDRPELQQKVRAAIDSASAYSAEHRVVWRDQSIRWLSSSGSIMEAEISTESPAHLGELRMAGVTLDITERVLSEMALRKADKFALVGRLSSSIAHEINNPLEAVTNLLYLLARSDLGVAEQEYVAIAQRELARVSEIAAQTLTFNRQQNAHEKAIIPDILDSVLALYQGRLTTSSIQVFRRYTDHRPVLCYPGELRQVFTNLIGNAFDATRSGGRLLVRARRATHPRSGQHGTRITIGDTGAGMTLETKSRIFEAFHSTKGNNGTGLGLWISRGIARKHGGSLRFSSSTRRGHTGTVFSLFIPLST